MNGGCSLVILYLHAYNRDQLGHNLNCAERLLKSMKTEANAMSTPLDNAYSTDVWPIFLCTVLEYFEH